MAKQKNTQKADPTVVPLRDKDVDRTLQSLQDTLESHEGGLLLDCAELGRIGTDTVAEFLKLARLGEQHNVEIKLQAVCIGVYRVLKLSHANRGFDFL